MQATAETAPLTDESPLLTAARSRVAANMDYAEQVMIPEGMTHLTTATMVFELEDSRRLRLTRYTREKSDPTYQISVFPGQSGAGPCEQRIYFDDEGQPHYAIHNPPGPTSSRVHSGMPLLKLYDPERPPIKALPGSMADELAVLLLRGRLVLDASDELYRETGEDYLQIDPALPSAWTQMFSEVRQARRMHAAGLTCQIGGVKYQPGAVAPNQVLAANANARQLIERQEQQHRPVYLGPSVTYGNYNGREMLTVYLSRARIANIGLWTPGKHADLKMVKFTSLHTSIWKSGGPLIAIRRISDQVRHEELQTVID